MQRGECSVLGVSPPAVLGCRHLSPCGVQGRWQGRGLSTSPVPAVLGGAGQPPCQGRGRRAPAPSTAAYGGMGSSSFSSGRGRALSRLPSRSPSSVSTPHPPPEEGSGSALRWLWGQPGFAALELHLQREVPVSACPAPSMGELPLPPPPPPNHGRPAVGLSWACGGRRGRRRVTLSQPWLHLGKRKSRLRLSLSSLFMWCKNRAGVWD